MPDLKTLANFAFRYLATTGYVGGAPNAVAFGTSHTDEVGGNTLFGPHLANVDIRGRVQLSGMRASTGGITALPNKAGGTALNCRSFGSVWVGQWPCGSVGNSRPLYYIGTDLGGGHVVLRQTADGGLAISRQSNANVQTFTGLKIPAGPTAILFNSTAGETWCKVLGQAAVTAAQADGASNNNFLGLMADPAGAGAERSWMLSDEFAFFSAGTTVKANAATIEADVISRYGLTIPTAGHIVCNGTSLGCGCYHLFGVSWPGEVAAAFPSWFVKNNCREGNTFAQALTDLNTLALDAADRVLGTDKPEMFIIELGANEVNSSVSLGTLQANCIAYISALRAAKPTAPIVVNTVVVISTTAAKNTIRNGFNAWLLAGALNAYGVIVNDVAGYDASFQPATNTDADVNACTGTSNFTVYDTALNPGLDHVHWSYPGARKLFPSFIAGAARGINSMAGAATHRASAPHMIVTRSRNRR